MGLAEVQSRHCFQCVSQCINITTLVMCSVSTLMVSELCSPEILKSSISVGVPAAGGERGKMWPSQEGIHGRLWLFISAPACACVGVFVAPR